jgi:hypothetical protein
MSTLIREAEDAATDAQKQVAESEALSRPLIDDLKAIRRRNHIAEGLMLAIREAR